MIKKKIYLHFSIDDVLRSLIEVKDKKIKLIDHWFFSILYKIHSEYKINICLYLFYEEIINGKLRNLSEIHSIRNQIKNNWLLFGAHGLNYNNPPHKVPVTKQKKHINKIYKEIIRFAGRKNLASKVRLHEYSECFEIKSLLKKYNVKSLFSTDREIGSHRLKKFNSNQLLKKGFTTFKGMNFIRTDLRVENMIKNSQKKILRKIQKLLEKKNFLIIYTHEYDLKNKNCRLTLKKIFKIINKNYAFINMDKT